MARKFLTHLDLAKNELQNAVVQNLASAPSSPVKGQLYFNSTGGDNTLYWWDGTQWIPAKAGGSSFPGYGSITAETTFGGSATDGVATTVARSDHKHANPLHDNAAHSTIPLNTFAVPTADVSVGGFKLTNVATPTVGSDAANMTYVNNRLSGLSWKTPVACATTANITLSGGQTIDGVVVAVQFVLVKNQTTASENGVYQSAAGAWTRSPEWDTNSEFPGSALFVMGGTTQADTQWVCTNDTVSLGSTAITFTQVGATTTYVGGAGLTLAGTTFNVVAGDTSLTVAADDVRVNTSVIATVASLAAYTKKFSQATIGGATSQVVTHNLNTQAVVVEVFRTLTPWESVECDVEHTSVNTVTLRFTVAPATNEFTCVVIG